MNEILTLDIQDSIYDSLPALERYLVEIRSRREQRRVNRQERERLEAAIGIVRAERQAALDDEDAEIAFELDAVLAEFQRRLERLAAPSYSQAVVSERRAEIADIPDAVISAQIEAEPITAEIPAALPVEEAFVAPELPGAAVEPEPTIPIAEIPAAKIEAVETAAPVFVEPEPVQRTEQETWAILENLWERLAVLQMRWREFDAQKLAPNEDANRPDCLRTRALVCEINALCAEATAEGLHDDLHPTAQDARDAISMARYYAKDTDPCLPFQEFCFAGGGPQIFAEDWRYLSELYEGAATAQEAWNWYAAQRKSVPDGAAYTLLNAVGAAQQMLFRELTRHSAGDRLQAELYGKLREASGWVGFLDSLAPDTHWTILEARASMLPDLLRDTRQAIIAAAEKRETDARRQEAIQAVVEWSQGRSRNDFSEDALARERELLLPLLDACIAAKVPHSNPQVRGAILDAAPRLLEGLPHYAKILEAVLSERKRKGLDLPPPTADAALAEEEEDLADSQVETVRDMVRTFAEGLSVIIVGGGARPMVAEKLKKALNCKDAEWIDSKKGDKMSKFKTQICNADIVIAVKNFASHEMTEKSRDWAKECDLHYVLLPGGYGVNQIIHQMHLQLMNGETSVKAPPPALKSSGLNLTLGVGSRTFAPLKGRD